MAMSWDNVELIRNAQSSARERFENTSLTTENEIRKALESETAKQLTLPRITEIEQMIFRLRSELIDYIVAHGLVNGLIWDEVLQPVKDGKIIITKEMVETITRKLGYFTQSDIQAFLEKYLPENFYVSDQNYIHTDNNFTDEDVTKLSDIEAGAEVNKVIDVIFNGTSVLDDGTRVATINITAEDIKRWYESNSDTNAFTDAQKEKLAGISSGAEVNRVDDVLVDGRSVLDDNKKAIITAEIIKAAYEKNADTNAFTDAEKQTLADLKTWKPEAAKAIAANAAGVEEAKSSISELGDEVNGIAGRVTNVEEKAKGHTVTLAKSISNHLFNLKTDSLFSGAGVYSVQLNGTIKLSFAGGVSPVATQIHLNGIAYLYDNGMEEKALTLKLLDLSGVGSPSIGLFINAFLNLEGSSRVITVSVNDTTNNGVATDFTFTPSGAVLLSAKLDENVSGDIVALAKRVTQNEQDIHLAQGTADTALEKANSAGEAAGTAQKKAEAAQTTADNAEAAANSATTFATNAQNIANSANEKAENALTQSGNALDQAKSYTDTKIGEIDIPVAKVATDNILTESDFVLLSATGDAELITKPLHSFRLDQLTEWKEAAQTINIKANQHLVLLPTAQGSTGKRTFMSQELKPGIRIYYDGSFGVYANGIFGAANTSVSAYANEYKTFTVTPTVFNIFGYKFT